MTGGTRAFAGCHPGETDHVGQASGHRRAVVRGRTCPPTACGMCRARDEQSTLQRHRTPPRADATAARTVGERDETIRAGSALVRTTDVARLPMPRTFDVERHTSRRDSGE